MAKGINNKIKKGCRILCNNIFKTKDFTVNENKTIIYTKNKKFLIRIYLSGKIVNRFFSYLLWIKLKRILNSKIEMKKKYECSIKF